MNITKKKAKEEDVGKHFIFGENITEHH